MTDTERLVKIFAATEHLESVRKDLLENEIDETVRREFEDALLACFNKLNDIRALSGMKTPYQDGATGPHYRHDDAIVTVTDLPSGPVRCHDRPYAFLRIRNTGLITWRGRCVRFIKPKAVLDGRRQAVVLTDRQPIPDLRRGESATIPIVIDAASEPGEFVLTCEIRDENDRNCFPNKPDLIRIELTVEG